MWQQSQYDEHQDEPNEAWRGDVHLDDESWLGGADTEAWRGDADAESWQDVRTPRSGGVKTTSPTGPRSRRVPSTGCSRD